MTDSETKATPEERIASIQHQLVVGHLKQATFFAEAGVHDVAFIHDHTAAMEAPPGSFLQTKAFDFAQRDQANIVHPGLKAHATTLLDQLREIVTVSTEKTTPAAILTQ